MELSVESLPEYIGIACQKVCTKMVSFATDRSWASYCEQLYQPRWIWSYNDTEWL